MLRSAIFEASNVQTDKGVARLNPKRRYTEPPWLRIPVRLPFYPTDPTPKYPGYLCNVLLKRDRQNVEYMMTEDEKDTFTDGTIVEFRYDMTMDAGWQWIPIRVRKKKTAEYRAGKNNFGNAYHVANSVWRSVHNPVRESMISERDI